jgi:hypothetical protein
MSIHERLQGRRQAVRPGPLSIELPTLSMRHGAGVYRRGLPVHILCAPVP